MFDDPTAFDTANDVFHQHTPACYLLIARFLLGFQLATFRPFDRLYVLDTRRDIALEAQLLYQLSAVGQRIGGGISHRFDVDAP